MSNQPLTDGIQNRDDGPTLYAVFFLSLPTKHILSEIESRVQGLQLQYASISDGHLLLFRTGVDRESFLESVDGFLGANRKQYIKFQTTGYFFGYCDARTKQTLADISCGDWCTLRENDGPAYG